MKRAFVPVASMLAIQVMISLSVLSLSVMMPAVAQDLAIDPKLVGVFTAIIYAVADVVALAAAGPIVRVGAVRVCQAALLMGAIGLALNSLALVATTVAAVAFIGAAQGPINPASAHILSQRVPREWFGTVFSLKQTGVPIGFALAGVIFPALMELVGWRGASLIAAGMLRPRAVHRRAAAPQPRCRRGRQARRRNSIWHSVRFVMGHRQLRVLGCVGLRLVIAQHTFTFYLVTYLYEHCGLEHRPCRRPAFALAAVRHRRAPAERRHGRPHPAHAAARLDRHRHDGRLPRHRACWPADTPFWLIALVVVGYGSVVISWNGTSQAEFAHLSPPGEAAAVAAVQTALAFSGAVFGPPLFALIARHAQLPHGLLRRRRLRIGGRVLANRRGTAPG